MKRKIIMATLALSMICSTNVFAADSNKIISGPSGDSMTDSPITTENQEKVILNDSNISDEQKTMFKQKFQYYTNLVSNTQTKGIVTPQAANDPSGSISVPYFKQDKNYYCGPATTKQTVHYINGSSDSQSTIASAIGTTTAGSNLADMQKYINSKQTKYAYIIVNSPSEDLIQSFVEYSVRNYAPTVLRLKIAKGGNWAYSSNGHFMNASGYTNYANYIEVTDPYIGWITADTTGKYYVTSNEIYTATNNHFAKQIMF